MAFTLNRQRMKRQRCQICRVVGKIFVTKWLRPIHFWSGKEVCSP